MEALKELLKVTDLEILKDANKRIVRRINDLLDIEAVRAKANFSEGDLVEWESKKRGVIIQGRIERINRKSATLAVIDRPLERWKVCLTLLKKVEA